MKLKNCVKNLTEKFKMEDFNDDLDGTINLHQANIDEDLDWSVITPGTGFTTNDMSVKQVLKFRRKNLTTTQMFWVKQQPVIDYANNLYNPKSLIMIILN